MKIWLKAKCTRFKWSQCYDIQVFHVCIGITVCIVVQFVSVDQPQRKQRAYRDRGLSRCFSSGSVVTCWLEFPLLCRLRLCTVKAHIFFRWVTPCRYSLYAKSGATLVGLALIWEIQLDSAHTLKQHDRRNIYSSDTQTGPVATGVLYGRIHFNISLHRSKSAANTPPTHALHILQKHHPRTTIIREGATHSI